MNTVQNNAQKVIMVCDLAVKNRFMLNNLEYLVVKIKGGRIYYRRPKLRGANMNSFGSKSKQKILLV